MQSGVKGYLAAKVENSDNKKINVLQFMPEQSLLLAK